MTPRVPPFKSLKVIRTDTDRSATYDFLLTYRTNHGPNSYHFLYRGAGHEKRRGEQLKCSLAFTLYIGRFHVHSYQDLFIKPGWAECVFCVFSLSFILCIQFICISLICLCVPILLCFSGQLIISFTVFGVIVTNLNEPPRALATYTIMWVRS